MLLNAPQDSPQQQQISPKSLRNYSKGLESPTPCQQDLPIWSMLEGRKI